MGSCCGRPANNANKGGAKSYYERYTYLSSHQRAKQAELIGSKCPSCDALTTGDPCTICGTQKTTPEVKEAKEG